MNIIPVHKHSIIEYDCELLSVKECCLPENNVSHSDKFPYMTFVIENGKSYIYNIYGKKAYTKYCSCPLWDNHNSVFYIDRKNNRLAVIIIGFIILASIIMLLS